MGAGASGKWMNSIFTFTPLPKQAKFPLRAISSLGALRMAMGELWYPDISWLPFLSSKQVRIYSHTSNSVFGWMADKNEATVLPKFGSQVLWCKWETGKLCMAPRFQVSYFYSRTSVIRDNLIMCRIHLPYHCTNILHCTEREKEYLFIAITIPLS